MFYSGLDLHKDMSFITSFDETVPSLNNLSYPMQSMQYLIIFFLRVRITRPR